MEEEIDGVIVRIHRHGWTVVKPNQHRPDGSVSSSGTISGYGDGWEKHIQPGTPVVDIRTIPDEKLWEWALKSPNINPDLEGIRGAKVEQNYDGIDKHKDAWVVDSMHPAMQALFHSCNLSYVSVEEYCLLAKEWGAEVHLHGGELHA